MRRSRRSARGPRGHGAPPRVGARLRSHGPCARSSGTPRCEVGHGPRPARRVRSPGSRRGRGVERPLRSGLRCPCRSGGSRSRGRAGVRPAPGRSSRTGLPLRRRVPAPGCRRVAVPHRGASPTPARGSAPHSRTTSSRASAECTITPSASRDERAVYPRTDGTEQIELAPDLVEGDDDAQVRMRAPGDDAGAHRRCRGETERRDRELVVQDVGSERGDLLGGATDAPGVGREHPVHPWVRNIGHRTAGRHHFDLQAVDAAERVTSSLVCWPMPSGFGG